MNKGKRKISVYWWFWIGMFALLLVVSAMQSKENHYVGETLITLGQYQQIEYIIFDKEINYITPTELGNLLTYNFYTTTNLDYLQLKPYTIFDSALFQVINKVIKDNFTIILIIIWLILYYISRFKMGLLYRWRLKIVHFLQKRADKQIPLMERHYVVDKPTDIKADGQRGIFIVRSWDVDDKGQLKSLVNDIVWEDKSITADKNPDKNNSKGVYGYRLGASIKQTGKVMGIAVLNGEYNYHPDGMVRAEHCDIIGFLISKGFERTARFISNKYGLPIYMANETEQAYYDWLFCEEGQKALQSNYELLK
jgi:hypothetical protein